MVRELHWRTTEQRYSYIIESECRLGSFATLNCLLMSLWVVMCLYVSSLWQTDSLSSIDVGQLSQSGKDKKKGNLLLLCNEKWTCLLKMKKKSKVNQNWLLLALLTVKLTTLQSIAVHLNAGAYFSLSSNSVYCKWHYNIVLITLCIEYWRYSTPSQILKNSYSLDHEWRKTLWQFKQLLRYNSLGQSVGHIDHHCHH